MKGSSGTLFFEKFVEIFPFFFAKTNDFFNFKFLGSSFFIFFYKDL